MELGSDFGADGGLGLVAVFGGLAGALGVAGGPAAVTAIPGLRGVGAVLEFDQGSGNGVLVAGIAAAGGEQALGLAERCVGEGPVFVEGVGPSQQVPGAVGGVLEVGVEEVAWVEPDRPLPAGVRRGGPAVAVEDLGVVGQVVQLDAVRVDDPAGLGDREQLVVEPRIDRAGDVAGLGDGQGVGLVGRQPQVGEAGQDES